MAFTASVRVNEAEGWGDGGRMVLRGLDEDLRGSGVVQAELIVNATTDAFLQRFPFTRAGMQKRQFRVTVEEI